MGRLDGKVAVILGASDARSMGAATALRFAAEGAKIVVAARRGAALAPIATAVNGIAVVCDITQETHVAELVKATIAHCGKIDIAVNYSGINSAAAVAEVTRESLLAACEVHLIGTALFFKHMGSSLSDGGSMITTSSVTATLAPPGLAAYAGTKKGSEQIMRIAAVEFGGRGIRVNAIAPGFTRSAMTEGYFAVPTLEAAFLREIPLGRLATVQDIANTALWLASDEAFITGQTLDISGGQSLRRIPTNEEMMR